MLGGPDLRNKAMARQKSFQIKLKGKNAIRCRGSYSIRMRRIRSGALSIFRQFVSKYA